MPVSKSGPVLDLAPEQVPERVYETLRDDLESRIAIVCATAKDRHGLMLSILQRIGTTWRVSQATTTGIRLVGGNRRDRSIEVVLTGDRLMGARFDLVITTVPLSDLELGSWFGEAIVARLDARAIQAYRRATSA